MKMLNNIHIPILLIILVLVVMIFRRMKKKDLALKRRDLTTQNHKYLKHYREYN